ncbi:MAG: hypothetical protein ACKVQB_09290 [Bacteroidia bacterium]
MNTPFRRLENLHILLWLLKDFCWLTDLKIPGLIMIIPTISVAVYFTYKNRKIASELWHNLAIVFWITANSVWMIGEFYFDDTKRNYAIIFFILGLLSVAYNYLISEPFWKKRMVKK